MGLFHLILYILSLVVAGFMVIVMKEGPSSLLESLTSATDSISNRTVYGLDLNNFRFNWMEHRSLDDDEQYFILVVFVACIICAVLLIYGAAKGEPSCMMPFFILKVFSFSVGCLYLISTCGTMVNNQFKLGLENPQATELDYTFLMISLAQVMGVWLEAFFAYVAWACYKHLKLTQTQNVPERTYYGNGEEAEMLLPPKYEDVIMIPVEQDPELPSPPPYQPPSN